MHDFRQLRHAGLTLVSGLLVGCGGGTEPETPDPVLAVVSGNAQSATVGEPVAAPLVVRVTQGGSPLSGTEVSWSVTGGGGSVDPASSMTNASGQASTAWTLGPNAGANTVQASVAGATGSPATFTASGSAPPPPPPMEAGVNIGDNFFDPSTQRVAEGGMVTWTWTGGNPHNVTFPAGTNSSTQMVGTFSRAFPTAGSFPYECTIHSGMTGTITVE